MRATLIRRVSQLEKARAASRNAEGLTAAEVFLNRICRREAQETGKPFDQVLREHKERSMAFWDNYDGDGSISDVLRYHRRNDMRHSRSGVANGSTSQTN